jgi:hypothetical protein
MDCKVPRARIPPSAGILPVDIRLVLGVLTTLSSLQLQVALMNLMPR